MSSATKASVGPFSAGWKAPGKHGNKGVEISYRTGADGSVHHLSYLSVNLDDKHLSDNDAFRKYAAKLKGSTTIFKATSYMTHNNDFSAIQFRRFGQQADGV